MGGLLAHRLGYTRSPCWRVFVRVSLFGFASLTCLLALWGFRASSDLGVLLAVQAGTWAALLTALRRWKNEIGLGGLNGWAGTVNTGAWLTSVSSAMGVAANQAAVTPLINLLRETMIFPILRGASFLNTGFLANDEWWRPPPCILAPIPLLCDASPLGFRENEPSGCAWILFAVGTTIAGNGHITLVPGRVIPAFTPEG